MDNENTATTMRKGNSVSDDHILTEAQVLACQKIAYEIVKDVTSQMAIEIMRQRERDIERHTLTCPTAQRSQKTVYFAAGLVAAGAMGGGALGPLIIKLLLGG